MTSCTVWPLPPVPVPEKLFFDPELLFYPEFAQHLPSVFLGCGVIVAQRHPEVAAGRNLLLRGLVPSKEEGRASKTRSQFQPDFYLIVAAGHDEAAGGFILEREVILGCEATEVLRSRTSETLFEALLLPNSLPWLVRLYGCTIHLDPPRYPWPKEAARTCVWSKSPKWLKVSCRPKML